MDAEEQVSVVHRVTIEQFKFAPQVLTVTSGDVVEWINLDIAPHTATEKDMAWDTRKLTKGETSRITFRKAGRYPYFCLFHPNMRGEIIVEAN